MLAYATDADPDTLINMSETMKQTFGLIRRPWGVFYLKNKITGQQTSLKTSDKNEAQRILQAHNESESQPHFNLPLARVYLNGAARNSLKIQVNATDLLGRPFRNSLYRWHRV